MDELANQIDELLFKKTLQELTSFATEVGITIDLTDKSKRQVRGYITKYYEEGIIEDSDKTNDDKKNSLVGIIEKLTLEESSEEKSTNENKNQQPDEENNTRGAQKQEDTTTRKTEEVKYKSEDGAGNIDFLKELGLLKKTGLLRKELKIRGQVGEPGQKDKLSYISLTHQIKNAKQAGYDEEEIVTAVINSMVPSLTLRSVLETTSNLTLSQLQQYLESHYGEQNATDLCNSLTAIVQFPEESCYDFVMRAIHVRQKLLLASERSDTGYSRSLVEKLFLRSLERGILSQAVVQEVKHILRKETVCDEEILSAITKAESYEQERLDRLSKSKPRNLKQRNGSGGVFEANVSTKNGGVGISDKSGDKSGKMGDTQSVSDPIVKLSSMVESLTLQLSSLQNEICNMKSSNYDGSRGIVKCKYCIENNINRCYHCYLCGSDRHYARQCKKGKDGKQGN